MEPVPRASPTGPRVPIPEHVMTSRTAFAGFTLALALAAGGLWAGGARSAPAPKSPPPEKVPEGGVEAEPAEGDAVQAQAASSKNLQRIALAVHSFIDDHKRQLPGDVTDKDGKALLSWRVQLLPYLEQAELYKQFKLDQPWDSETNKKLLAKMPAVFSSPRVRVKSAGHTVYQGFA